jgi:hypothetical protein
VKSSTLTSLTTVIVFGVLATPVGLAAQIITFDPPGARTGTSHGQGSQIYAVDRVTENNFTVDTGHSNNRGGEHE